VSDDERTAEPQADEATATGTPAAPMPPDDGLPKSGPSSAERVTELERRVAELEQALAKERDAATDYMNRWQHTQADFTNYRRRQGQEREQMQRFFATEATRLVLPALDSFERAFATLPPSLQRFTWIDGVALINMQLQGALQAMGIKPIAAEQGQTLDPVRHEAIGEVETGAHPAGHIAAIVQRGYEVEGTVLRPTLVQVARAPRPAEATIEQEVEPAAPAEGPAP
jgi:molecular chaperone GrpE